MSIQDSLEVLTLTLVFQTVQWLGRHWFIFQHSTQWKFNVPKEVHKPKSKLAKFLQYILSCLQSVKRLVHYLPTLFRFLHKVSQIVGWRLYGLAFAEILSAHLNQSEELVVKEDVGRWAEALPLAKSWDIAFFSGDKSYFKVFKSCHRTRGRPFNATQNVDITLIPILHNIHFTQSGTQAPLVSKCSASCNFVLTPYFFLHGASYAVKCGSIPSNSVWA